MKFKVGDRIQFRKKFIKWNIGTFLQIHGPISDSSTTETLAMWVAIDAGIKTKARITNDSPWDDLKGLEYKVVVSNKYGSDSFYVHANDIKSNKPRKKCD
jgi:hypothetical protein